MIRAGLSRICQMRACGLRNVALSRDTLILILRGVKTVDAQRAEEGSLLYFPAGRVFSLTNTPDAEGRYLALMLSFHDETLIKAASIRPPFSAPRPHGNALLITLLSTLLDVHLDYDDEQLARMQQEQLLYALHGAGIPLFQSGHSTAARVRTLVEADPGSTWTSAEIAARLHMSERSLRRRLEESGTNLAEILRIARLHAGLSLLQQSDFNVAQTSLACGYTSPSRFAARFREHFGITPKEVIRSRGLEAGTGAS